MRIRIKFEDVRFGQQRQRDACMVARAIKRQVPEFANRISVDSSNVCLVLGRGPQLLALPEFVGRKIDAFDKHRWVWPFSFDLPIEAVLLAEEPAHAEVEELDQPVLA